MLNRLLPGAVLLLVLAGCAQPALNPAASSPPPVPALAPQPPAFQDCVVGATVTSFPSSIAPGTVPPGWGVSPGLASDVRIELLDCQKVAWGPFERGPVQLMVELHTKGALPQNCTFDRPDQIYNLERILVSDAEIAHYARAHDGIVADEGSIHVGLTHRTDQLTQQDWTWGPPGQPSSKLTVAASDTLLPYPTRNVERWIWANGTGLGVLDVSRDYVAGAETYAASGEMHPPMLYAQVVPSGTYAGIGDAGASFHATSKQYQFGDAQCEQPSPS